MKIAITGHTTGLGKAIYDYCVSNNHECVGLSRSNGNDISDVDSILSKVSDADVFVNNAYHNFFQVELFDNWYLQHKTETKTIVNISSLVKYSGTNNDIFPHLYVACKKELEKHSKKAKADIDRVCRIINFTPGAVDTSMNNLNLPLVDPNKCAEIVYWAITQPSNIEIGELSIKSLFDK